MGDHALAFLEAGDDGPLLLWLHGFPRNAYVWRRCLPLAAKAGFRSIAPDLPGLGDSTGPQAADYTPSAMADVLSVFLAQRGEDEVRVIGEGLGATVAARLAARDTARVRAVVLCDAPSGPVPLAWAARAGLGEGLLSALAMRRLLDRLDSCGPLAAGDALERDLALRPLLRSAESRARAAAVLAAGVDGHDSRVESLPTAVRALICRWRRNGASSDAVRVPSARLPAAAPRLAVRDPGALLDLLLPFLRGQA